MRGSRALRWAGWFAAVLVASGCTGRAADTTATTPSVPPTSAQSLVDSAPGPGHDSVEAVLSEAVPAQPERLLRSAADVAPFAAADYFMSDAVRRLRVPLNAHDRPGPLHWFYESTALSSPVYDMCDDAQAYEAHTGEAYQQGGLFPGNTYPELVSERGEMGCDDPSFGAERPRWALRVNDWGGLRRFQTREGAVEYQQLLLAGHRERNKNTIEVDTHELSPHGNTSDFLIRFADASSPVDEVRLLEGSVQVVDGVLRGLVRNWSRHLWAYKVTVDAEGREFSWPLSV
ncbi:hypothetical protein [Candidatus Poriferisodalis sp.]|uniref:hypothetical protein n=1 Tax=Candidatus Poriferisodalis sp. TaxID=3101277 RepID=UPI003AF7F527